MRHFHTRYQYHTVSGEAGRQTGSECDQAELNIKRTKKTTIRPCIHPTVFIRGGPLPFLGVEVR